MLKSVVPILFVEAIEPCLPFWIERFGCAVYSEVPDGDRLGFVILGAGELTVMYQTFASLATDLPAIVPQVGNALYVSVEDFDATVEALEGAEIVVPPRMTFYGAEEIWVREPGGTIVAFAKHHDAN